MPKGKGKTIVLESNRVFGNDQSKPKVEGAAYVLVAVDPKNLDETYRGVKKLPHIKAFRYRIDEVGKIGEDLGFYRYEHVRMTPREIKGMKGRISAIFLKAGKGEHIYSSDIVERLGYDLTSHDGKKALAVLSHMKKEGLIEAY